MLFAVIHFLKDVFLMTYTTEIKQQNLMLHNQEQASLLIKFMIYAVKI